MDTLLTVDGPNVLDVPGAQQAVGVMAVLFAVFGVLFVSAVAFIIYTAVRRARAARSAGLDPFAGDIQLMGAAKQSQMLAPERSLEERLAEVDALLASGTITQDEHDAARARLISTL
jgi:hypothetical protein